jgi:hypothetical protein
MTLNHAASFSAEVKNEWSHTSTLHMSSWRGYGKVYVSPFLTAYLCSIRHCPRQAGQTHIDKVKSSLWLVKHDAIMAYGGVELYFHTFLAY